MTHTTHEALRELDRVAEDVERRGLPFDMGTYGDADCGTAACLAGWAIRYPWFKRRGLRRDKKTGVVTFKHHASFSSFALLSFFALDHGDIFRLFYAIPATITDQRAVIADLLATVPDNVVEG